MCVCVYVFALLSMLVRSQRWGVTQLFPNYLTIQSHSRVSIHISNLHAVSPGFPVSHLRLRLPSHFTSAFLRSLSIYLSIYHSISLSPAFSRSINFMAVVAPSLLAPKQLRRQLLCFGSCSKICCMCFLLSSSFFALFASLLFSLLCFLLCVFVAFSAAIAAAGHDVKGTN